MRFIYVISILLYLTSCSVWATKKACQPYLDKLRNIQSQQRAGYSNKKGRSLADREQKARDKWWQCQQGKLKKNKSKKSKAKTKKANKSTTSYSQLSQLSSTAKRKPNALSFTGSLTIKAKFSGRKQQAWLDYYQQPQKCKQPKSTKIFAFCLEDEQRQQDEFDRQYQ
ncbi:hypothetical protein Q4493_03485 [Colwellia sp. 1_MG-2023]|uniref:hypothetical protein n=1 Tax=Colwellia sp. 1_MG-2023 TaxID=3062649 RepID=UPI0026E3A709|nr:hypothetical protein [Colwellia sp. 1_MG-2023]MDO6444833.1 hypothetical protein [Colwellia sp. 1_MG-2023]